MATPEVSFLPLTCGFVPEHFRTKAETQLGESEESAAEGLRKLREFLKNENYPPNDDDTFLLQFLRQQKFNERNAEKKLKQHYSMRGKTSELYQNIDLETVRSIMDSKVVGLFPFRDAEGRTIVYTNSNAVDLERFKASDLFKCTLALFHFACSFPLTAVAGLNLVGEASYPKVNDAFKIFKEAMNFVWIQLHFHGSSMDFVHKVYHPSILPNEFGGTMGPLNNDSYMEGFLEYTKKLKAECHLYNKLC
ncbi:clavesin-1-like [Uloborus diversus]|uniref:clavesin-1-like n=1 Tax=Uloborus diversus TaxID=327109 RepID=UPI002409AB57|nr:clavesin-1-like [Uloborus diversus]